MQSLSQKKQNENPSHHSVVEKLLSYHILPERFSRKISYMPLLEKINTSIYISIIPLLIIFFTSLVIIYFKVIIGNIENDLQLKSQAVIKTYKMYSNQAKTYSKMISSLKEISTETITNTPNRGKLKKIIHNLRLQLNLARIGIYARDGELLASDRDPERIPEFSIKQLHSGIITETFG